MIHTLESLKTFPRPQRGGPSTRFVLPSGHGGPEGAEPQPMTVPVVVQPVGEEAPLLQRTYQIAVSQHHKQSRVAMQKLPLYLKELAQNERRLRQQEYLASRSQRQSAKDRLLGYGQRETHRLNQLTVGR